MATNATTIGVPLEPWNIAKDRFLEGLSSDEQRELFQSASLESVFYVASAGFKHHEVNSKIAVARKRLKPLLDSIDGYGKALDVLSQSSASILCPLWGSLRIVLHLAIDYDKYFNKLLKMYEQIGDTLPRFRAYEALFPNHDRLLSALADAYLEIVKFSYDASRIFVLPQSKLKQSFNPIKDRWKPFERQFDEYMDKFRRYQQNVAEEAHVAHMIESKKTQELVLADRALQKRNAEMDDFRKIRNLLSTYDYRAKHRTIRSLRHEGTTTWFMQQEAVRKWLKNDSSDVFYCFGIPGAGKTIIASSVIDQALEGDAALPSSICYHYCDYADAYTLEIRNIICNMARQQLDKHLMIASVLERCRPALESNFPLSLEDAIFCWGQALEKEKPVLLVIDGIDELTPYTQDLLLETLDQFRSSVSLPIKTFIFCRPDERLMRQNLEKYASITITLAENGGDLCHFIEQRVKACRDSGQLVFNDAALEKEIINALKTGAEHMFLWAKFQIEELCYAYTEDAIREVLRDLPKTLKETYDRILHRIKSKPGGDRLIGFAKKILMWLTCARRPLTLDELGEAVAIEDGDKGLRRDRIAKDDLFLFEACSNLVTLSEEDGTLRFSHHTVRQYLIGECLDGSLKSFEGHSPLDLSQAQPKAWFDVQEAQFYVARICLTYLEFSDFETQVMRTSVYQPPSNLFASSVIKHARIVRHANIIPLLAIVRGAARTPAHRQAISLPVPSSQSSTGVATHFQLLNYVVDNWTSHCNNATIPGWCLTRLIFDKQSWVDFRPWRTYKPHKLKDDYMSLRLFRWAIDHNLSQFLDSFTRTDLRECFDHDCGVAMSQPLVHPILRSCSKDARDAAHFLALHLFPRSREHGIYEDDTLYLIGMVLQTLERFKSPERDKIFATLYRWDPDSIPRGVIGARSKLREEPILGEFIMWMAQQGHLKTTKLLSYAVSCYNSQIVKFVAQTYFDLRLFRYMDVWIDCVSAVKACIIIQDVDSLGAMECLHKVSWVDGSTISPFREVLLNFKVTNNRELLGWLWRSYLILKSERLWEYDPGRWLERYLYH